MSRSMQSATRTIALDYSQVFTLEGARGTSVHVLHGGVWLTEEGDTRDRFARRGDVVMIGSHGRTVIEPLGRARIELREPRRLGWLRTIGRALQAGAQMSTARLLRT